MICDYQGRCCNGGREHLLRVCWKGASDPDVEGQGQSVRGAASEQSPQEPSSLGEETAGAKAEVWEELRTRACTGRRGEIRDL